MKITSYSANSDSVTSTVIQQILDEINSDPSNDGLSSRDVAQLAASEAQIRLGITEQEAFKVIQTLLSSN